MMRTIHLAGEMRARFGGPFNLHVATPVEAVRALGAQLPGFRRYIRETDFRFVAVAPPEVERAITVETLTMQLGRATELHIVPVIAGSGVFGDVAKIVGGLAIAGLAWWAAPAAGLGATAFAGISYGQIAGFGLMFALSGAAGALTSTPSKKKTKDSIVFSGAQNTTEEGACIPWIWGTTRIGSVIGSSGVSSEDIGVYA